MIISANFHIVILIILSIWIGTSLTCSSIEDCHMNGICVNSSCICDSGWSGSSCSNLTFLPAPIIGSYGYSPNVTSWGGLPIMINNLYHLFVTEIVNDCGLCTWMYNSRVIHAISDSLLGPYSFVDVALNVWAHNPHIMVDTSSGAPVYLLFHIGDADGGVSPILCNSSSFKLSSSSPSSSSFQPSGVLHTSSSPYGPWVPQIPPGLEDCNNPAPFMFPNGTIFLVCSPLWSSGSINVFSAPSWKGPWSSGNLNFTGNPGEGIWEDPFIWVDQRGVFKMLAHVYPNNKTIPFWDRVSGFGYSYDGFNWVLTPDEPYTNEVTHVNGITAYTTRERPKIFFDPKDNVTPLALFNGVAEGSNCYDCKGTCGVDWTYNIAVEIAP